MLQEKPNGCEFVTEGKSKTWVWFSSIRLQQNTESRNEILSSFSTKLCVLTIKRELIRKLAKNSKKKISIDDLLTQTGHTGMLYVDDPIARFL